MSGREVLCRADEVMPGRLHPVRIGRATALVTRLADGTLRAFAARCPHQGADLAAGCVVRYVDGERPGALRVEDGRDVVRCPWHGFEYFAATGEPTVPSPGHHRLRLRTFAVEVVGGDVVLAG
jgi:3-phenylpropionate/trans-cinnamate dioxygenase ferredoxin subunit